MAHPYTLPVAVGGYDIKDEKRWRRPEQDPYAIANYAQARREDGNDYLPETSLREGGVGLVRLFDVARGMAQRVEGQYRRNWSYLPAVWNLHVRERVNLGASLKISETLKAGTVSTTDEMDIVMAAAELYKKLETGLRTNRLHTQPLIFKCTH